MLLGNYAYPHDYRVRQEARSLVDAGHRVAVIAPAGKGQRTYEVVDSVAVYRYPNIFRGHSALTYALEYLQITLASLVLSWVASVHERTAVVHAHNPPDTFFMIGAFYKLLGRKFVFDHHDVSPELYRARFPSRRHRPFIYRALVLFEKLSCRLADRIIATNESYKRIEIERANVHPDRVSVVRNGPGPDKLELEDVDAELRARSQAIIGYIGVMGYQDGIDYLLRALQVLIHDLERTDAFCVLIGEGDARDDLRDLARELDVAEHVCFPGRLPDRDVRRLLCTADVCVDPDPSNAFNDMSTMQKIMDYMALGRPVVAFDLPEHRATAGEAAVFVEPNDERALARGIASLLDDPERRDQLGRIGRRRVEEKLAWSHSVEPLLELYRSLLPNATTSARRSGDAPNG